MSKLWTEEEKEIIKKYYPIEGKEIVKRFPNKTLTSIRSKVSRLNLNVVPNLLIDNFPELAKEYNQEKNEIPLDKITVGCNKKVWWIGKCGHEWKVSINHRTSQNSKCPYCSKKKIIMWI